MKNDIILIPLFLLLFIIFFALFTTLDLFAFWTSLSSYGSEKTGGQFLFALWPKLVETLPVSLFFTIVFIEFRILMKPGTRFFSFLILLLLSLAILVFGVKLLSGFEKSQTSRVVTEGIEMIPGRINPMGRYLVYPIAVSGNLLKGVAIAEKEERSGNAAQAKEAPVRKAPSKGKPEGAGALRFVKEAQIVEKGKEIRLEGSEGTLFSVYRSEIPARPFSMKDQHFIETFLRDIAFFNEKLLSYAKTGGKDFYMLAFAILFLFLASGFFMRITRWPLFNLLFSFLASRAYFSLYSFLAGPVSLQIAKYMGKSEIAGSMPAYVMILIGILLLLIDILFVPFDRWKREIEE